MRAVLNAHNLWPTLIGHLRRMRMRMRLLLATLAGKRLPQAVACQSPATGSLCDKQLSHHVNAARPLSVAPPTLLCAVKNYRNGM